MEISHLIEQLDNRKKLPGEAIRELMARKEESTPALLEVLTRALSGYKRIDPYQNDHIFALYILSYFREPLAFPYVLKFAQLPADWMEKVFGDHTHEGLPSWLVSTYNGDLDSLKSLIENKTAYTYSRNAALRSLLGLCAIDELSREEIIDYFRELIHSPLVQDYEFTTWVIGCASKLYPQELYEDIMNLYDRNLVEQFFISRDTIDEILEEGKEDCLQSSVYTDNVHLPVTDVIKSVSWMRYEDERTYDNTVDEGIVPAFAASETYKRDTIKIGRNDPCYCGSAKKYKKCCLRASP